MKPRSPVRRVMFGVLILGFVAFAIDGAYQWSRFVVSIENNGLDPISKVELTVTGDKTVIEELPSGDKRDIVLKPEGESRVELNYSLGESRCRWRGGQVKQRGGHRVRLEIRGCGEIRASFSRWPERAPEG